MYTVITNEIKFYTFNTGLRLRSRRIIGLANPVQCFDFRLAIVQQL